jgi:hypothetical protein
MPGLSPSCIGSAMRWPDFSGIPVSSFSVIRLHDFIHAWIIHLDDKARSPTSLTMRSGCVSGPSAVARSKHLTKFITNRHAIIWLWYCAAAARVVAGQTMRIGANHPFRVFETFADTSKPQVLSPTLVSWMCGHPVSRLPEIESAPPSAKCGATRNRNETMSRNPVSFVPLAVITLTVPLVLSGARAADRDDHS